MSNQLIAKLILPGLLLLHISFWFILHPVTPKTDDSVYFYHAHALNVGEYHLTDSPKNHRLSVIVPTALFIRIFGESPLAISLWPLICSLATISVLFFFLLKHSSLLTAFVASFLLSCNTIQITYSAALFPDVIVALFALLCMVQVFNRGSSSDLLHAFLASLFFFLGFLAKEIIILLLPFIAFLFIADFLKKQNTSFWKSFFVFMILFAMLITGVYYFLTGEWNFIYQSINKNHNEVFAIFNSEELLKRFTYEPAVFLFKSIAYSVLLILGLHFLISKPTSLKAGLKNATAFFAFYFLTLLICYWWLPTSFSHLSPILLFGYERMWMLLLVPLAIISSVTITEAIKDRNNSKLNLIIFLFLAAAIAAGFISGNRAVVFLLFAFAAMLVLYLKRKNISEWFLAGIMVSPALVIAIYFVIENSNL